MLYTSVWLREKWDWQDLVYFVYWINKINKRMKYLASWLTFIWSAESNCFDLVWRCFQVTLSATAGDSTACVISACPIYVIPGFKHRLQKILFVEKKKMIGWKIDVFFITEYFWGFWIDNAWSLCAEAMIFSVLHWPLLDQNPVAVIFFCSVDVCWSVFCVL